MDDPEIEREVQKTVDLTGQKILDEIATEPEKELKMK
jgi:hypothetical protein